MRLLRLGVVAAVVGLAGAWAAESASAVKNGRFDKKRHSWRTDPGMDVVQVAQESLDPNAPAKNAVLQVTVHKKRDRVLSQKLRLDRKTKALKVRVRLKSNADYVCAAPSAGNMILRFKHSKGSIYSVVILKEAGKWQDLDWLVADLGGQRSLELCLEFKPGQGTISVDDIEVVELAK